MELWVTPRTAEVTWGNAFGVNVPYGPWHRGRHGERLSEVSRESRTTEDGMFVPFGTPLAEIERRVIHETLERTGGDKKTAAHLLGIATRTIYRKVGE